jgi:hypothetical protein
MMSASLIAASWIYLSIQKSLSLSLAYWVRGTKGNLAQNLIMDSMCCHGG